MRNLTRIFLALIVSCFLAGPLHAAMADPNVAVKGYAYDNDTGGSLTTATKNVGISIEVTNNTTNTVALSNIRFGGITLNSFQNIAPTALVPAPQSNAILWANGGFKIDNTYGSQSISLDPHYSQVVPVAILPVVQGQFYGQAQQNGTALVSKITSLAKGMYHLQLHFVTVDTHGVISYWGAQTDPIVINS